MSANLSSMINQSFLQTVNSINTENQALYILDRNEADNLAKYLELIKSWNDKVDLVSPQSDELLISKHLVDCALASRFITAELSVPPDQTYLDVGTGAGLPGIVLSILEPERKIFLVEPRQKRCGFLKEVKRQLSLQSVVIQNCRVEEFNKEKSEVGLVITRALGKRENFLKEAARILSIQGFVVEMFTENGAQKITPLPSQRSLSYTLFPDLARRTIVGYPKSSLK